MPSTDTYQLLLAAAAACEDKKAEDIRILALDPSESGLTDYFLITNGTNDRQNVAITDEIELRLKRDFGVYPNSVEGRRQGEWILMDYVDFVVHIFLTERRAYYDIERLRKSARHMAVDDLKAALTEKTLAVRKKAPVKAADGRKAGKAPAKSVPRKTAAKKAAKGAAKKATKAAAANRTRQG